MFVEHVFGVFVRSGVFVCSCVFVRVCSCVFVRACDLFETGFLQRWAIHAQNNVRQARLCSHVFVGTRVRTKCVRVFDSVRVFECVRHTHHKVFGNCVRVFDRTCVRHVATPAVFGTRLRFRV